MRNKQELKAMSMSEIIEAYNTLSTTPVTEFKSLSFARDELHSLEKKLETATDVGTPVGDDSVPAVVTHKIAGDNSKYDSREKRGPNQGVGAYAKGLLLEGNGNADVLRMVMERFPVAKTSKGCIAFYRTALQRDGKLGKNGQAIAQNPDDIIAKAQAAIDAANAAIASAHAQKEAAAAAPAEAIA